MGVRVEDLQLEWPRELFVAELAATITETPDPWANPFEPDTAPRVRHVKEDACRRLFEEACYAETGERWFDAARDEGVLEYLATEIISDPSRVPMHAPPVLFRDRKPGASSRAPGPSLTALEFNHRLARIIGDFDNAGYFDLAFGESCVDTSNDHVGRAKDGLSYLMRSEEEWPPVFNLFDIDHTYTVLEAVHHLVARPRERYRHDNGREWHYRDFDRAAGQGVYRWRVNRLLELADNELRLDPTGMLVETTGDARDQLLNDLVQDDQAPAPDALQHAIAQFRHRGASRVDKRAAVVLLAGILEEHRALLKEDLLRGDEGALFEIANRFAIRHQNANQRPDYEDAYLDWIFWWYLATVDLVKHLLTRRRSS